MSLLVTSTYWLATPQKPLFPGNSCKKKLHVSFKQTIKRTKVAQSL